MKVLKHALSPSIFFKIKNTIEGLDFPWYYLNSTAYEEESDAGSFYHVAFDRGKNSECSDLLEFALLNMLDKMGVTLKNLIRIRLGLIPISTKTLIHSPHVDFAIPHKVGLLYINDSDGDTIIYNEKYNIDYKEGTNSYYQNILNGQVSIFERLTPEENKFIMFDGMSYHSSSTPIKTKRRLVVNYNFETT